MAESNARIQRCPNGAKSGPPRAGREGRSARGLSGPRGFTLVEALVMGAVLALGLASAMQVATASAAFSRRNLAQTQATLIAERELERLIAMGCDDLIEDEPCKNIKDFDSAPTRSVWWSADGEAYEDPPGATDPPRREYRISVDVDPPYEGDEHGEPDMTQPLAGAGLARRVNVRVQVSWTEPGRPRQVVALQTRIAP
jgi:type II secretory pathway pseudopilin PulG